MFIFSDISTTSPPTTTLPHDQTQIPSSPKASDVAPQQNKTSRTISNAHLRTTGETSAPSPKSLSSYMKHPPQRNNHSRNIRSPKERNTTAATTSSPSRSTPQLPQRLQHEPLVSAPSTSLPKSINFKTAFPNALLKSPALLQICRESRFESLRIYKPFFRTDSRLKNIYGAISQDTIITSESFDDMWKTKLRKRAQT